MKKFSPGKCHLLPVPIVPCGACSQGAAAGQCSGGRMGFPGSTAVSALASPAHGGCWNLPVAQGVQTERLEQPQHQKHPCSLPDLPVAPHSTGLNTRGVRAALGKLSKTQASHSSIVPKQRKPGAKLSDTFSSYQQDKNVQNSANYWCSLSWLFFTSFFFPPAFFLPKLIPHQLAAAIMPLVLNRALKTYF